MRDFNPYKGHVRALEKNILKYRAFQMILILFYVEDIKKFSLRAIQGTDELFNKKNGSLKERKRYIKNYSSCLWSWML